MKYKDIKDLVIKNRISDIDLEIVSCVNSTSDYLSENEYNSICEYIKQVWYRLNSTYIQLLADIVCDLYQNLQYGYHDLDTGKYLTKTDLIRFNKIDIVMNIYYDKYSMEV